MSRGLRFRTREQFPIATVEFEGELDFGTAATMRSALNKQLAEQPAALLVDLAALVVRHRAALSVLRSGLRAAHEWPGILVVLYVPDQVLRTALFVGGFDRHAQIVGERRRAFALAAQQQAPRRQILRGLPADPHVLRQVRQLVGEACAAWGIPENTSPAQLVACELLANSIEHAGTSADFTMALRGRYLHLVVRDDSPLMPRPAGPVDSSDPRGRGLQLVEDLSTSWGCARADEGKVVWAMLPVESARRADSRPRVRAWTHA